MLHRTPDTITVRASGLITALHRQPDASTWSAGDITVRITGDRDDRFNITLNAGCPVERIALRWHCDWPDGAVILGDHWERGYGDMAWRTHCPERVLPWYFLTHDRQATTGVGVMTAAASFAHWRTDGHSVSLYLDVRSGGVGVELGDRALTAATVITCRDEQRSPFDAAHQFCRMLCPNPRLPRQPVYGGNDWYYAYGNNSAAQIRDDAARIASWAPDGDNRPIMVIDDGWELCHDGPARTDGGPWLPNSNFDDMAALADHMRSLGVRPGIWLRPLLTVEKLPASQFLPLNHVKAHHAGRIIDPSVPESIAHIERDIQRLVDWGFELIKHDWTTFDLLGMWGFEMGGQITNEGWAFADRSRTSAEIVGDLYRAIRRAAGDEAMLIGCNTIGHLAAGLVELQRTGDDTSGRNWERTRRMGINTLAMRMPQHNAFFAADADCVGLTNEVPWALNSQWLDLLARSGTPLFVSASPDAIGPEQEHALRRAFAIASQTQPPAEPLDWMNSTSPTHWRFGDAEHTYDWHIDDDPWLINHCGA